MGRKRYTVEQIIRKVREAEVELRRVTTLDPKVSLRSDP
jgi:hypothetical protein